MSDPKHLSIAPHCSTCGVLFATAYDLFNHTRNGYLVNNDRPTRDKIGFDDRDENGYDDTDAVEEVKSNPTFQWLFDDAKLDNEKAWLEKWKSLRQKAVVRKRPK